MNIKVTPQQRVNLETLDFGEVFHFPNEDNQLLMVVDNSDLHGRDIPCVYLRTGVLSFYPSTHKVIRIFGHFQQTTREEQIENG